MVINNKTDIWTGITLREQREVRRRPSIFYARGFGIRTVTLLPDMILGFIGRRDATKGVDASYRIDKYNQKIVSLEARESLKVERKLRSIRMACSVYIPIAERIKAEADKAADEVEMTDEPAAVSIRKARRLKSKYYEYVRFLAKAAERITNFDTIFRERILKTRAKAENKANAYLAGYSPDVKPKLQFSNQAADTYYSCHAAIDSKIKEYVTPETMSLENSEKGEEK